jgi:translation initiation factor IF-2
LATVRIYKVAELLNTSSQEVMALLKRDHGIEVKSASSTIEEVVARQFVDRLARLRGIALPSGDIFAETPVARGKRPAPARKVEPAKPVVTLPPPRLVKTAKPAAPPVAPPVSEAPPPVTPPPAPAPPQERVLHLETPERPHVVEQAPPRLAEAERPAPPVDVVEEAEPAAGLAPPLRRIAEGEAPLSQPVPAEAVAEPGATPAPSAAEPAAPAAAAHGEPAPPRPETPTVPAAAPAARPAHPAPPIMGRVVPPTLRLRVEESRPTPTPPKVREIQLPQPMRPAAPVQPPKTGERAATPAASRPRTAATTPGAAAPPSRVVRPPAAPPRPVAAPGARTGQAPRPIPPVAPPRPVSGGPRPLPSQPVRLSQPPRPTGAVSRPGAAPSRPAAPRPGGRPLPGGRRETERREMPRVPAATLPAGPPPITRTITMAEGMTVKDLAEKLDLRAKDVLKKLLDRRIMVTINTTLDPETATSIARDFGADVTMRTMEEELLEVEVEEVKPEDRTLRAPVVTVMGHVDHGKTTLLDAIRETRVAEREAGGITQHIGAYHVKVHNRPVVFLDTPGHEAFTMMRARGARVTDIVILVVAADDGVMPQTKEAIDHARAANVPIIVALNKIDKPNANPERVKRELADLNLVPEEWGGQTIVVELSAKKRQNLDALLEMVLLVSDIGELKASPKRNAIGTVLEAKLDKGRGPVATLLVQDGTLHVGDTFIAGPIVGKVRALIDDRSRHVKSAGPSTPVEVLGLGGLPQPGDSFQAISDAAKARQVAMFRQAQVKEKALGARGGQRLTLESLKQQIAEGEIKELPIIIKADVQGSAEVLADTLVKLSDDKVKIKIIHSGVGSVNESDVLLASASNAIIIGFDVRPDRNAAEIADREKVDIRLHSVIYNVIDEMKKAMTGLLEPTLREQRLGTADVRNTFKVPKFGTIAGCMVTEGRIMRSGDSHARLLRDNQVVFEGKIGSLRRFKDDVSEVKAGIECGIGLERFNDIKVGDQIEVFTVERVAATVS